MDLDKEQITVILLEGGYISAEELESAQIESDKLDGDISSYLLSQNLITKDIIGQAFAEHFKVPYADLNTIVPSKEQILKIPEKTARSYNLVLFKEDKKEVIVATDNPKQRGLNAKLKALFPKFKVVIAYSLTEDIEKLFTNYRKPLKTRLDKIIKSGSKVAPSLVDELIEDAADLRASDIHFEPRGEEVVIRFRVDGVLREAGRFSKEYYESILNRIKVQAHLRIDQHYSTQDGSIRLSSGDKELDLRVSIAPTLGGEKIVIRVLAQYLKGLSLGDLGLSESNQTLIKQASKKPFGMIVVTGPTGSGKTTTLYALLQILNDPEVNITTIEDPVEYRTLGVNQIQVNSQTGLTFAKGLRSIVRQDPDIILVGEIRDQETAEIGVNAALTGHLLLSTFHANDAATSIPRFLDMGVEPFLLASTLELLIAQRLVRKICDHCIRAIPMPTMDSAKFSQATIRYFKGKKISLYTGKGCDSCNSTGYQGRTAIYEFIQMTQEMRTLIMSNPSKQKIWELAKKQGSKSLFEDGMEKVKQGVTTLEELLRVAAPSDVS